MWAGVCGGQGPLDEVILPTAKTGTLPSLDEECPGPQVGVYFCPGTAKETEAQHGVVVSPGALSGTELGCLGHAAAQPTASLSSSEAVEIRIFCLLVIRKG